MDRATRKQITVWLWTCCALIFLMVVVGGVTRLTHSGLSVTEWRPLVGAVPPLDEAQWTELFEKYQQTPEYQKINRAMTLEEFRGIFWWEYFHRLLGRVIALAFLLPFLYFLARKKIDPPRARHFALIFALGGLQGALGWLLVRSGLIDEPHVSPYRLAAHLGLAFAIYGAILRTALQLRSPGLAAPQAHFHRSRVLAAALAGLIFLMVFSGALVAGTRAGFVYNTFPLMDGRWLPPDAFSIAPWYRNFFENAATVQFDHRVTALVVVIAITSFWWHLVRGRAPRRVRWAGSLLVAAAALQVTLGITTLLYLVPLPLAAAHQAGALLLFTAAVFLHQELERA